MKKEAVRTRKISEESFNILNQAGFVVPKDTKGNMAVFVVGEEYYVWSETDGRRVHVMCSQSYPTVIKLIQ